MNREELHTLIAQTVRPNNKKQINAESLANLFYEMVDATPEGGGGLKYSEERTLYGINEEVMTDEQKAYNAETYKKISNGEAVTINMSGYILTPTVSSLTDDFIGFTMMMKSDEYNINLMVKLHSDGSVEVSSNLDFGGANIIYYGDAESAKGVFAQPDFMLKDICIFLQDAGIARCTLVSISINDRAVLSCPLPTQNLILTYNTETGEITDELVIDTVNVVGMVYINVSETNSSYSETNKSAVSTEYGHEVFYAKDKNNGRFRYQSISIEQVLGEYLKITIYRNNTFETWQINADGTSTLTA